MAALALTLAGCSSGGGKKTASPTTTATTAPESTVVAGAPKEPVASAVTTSVGPTTTRPPDVALTTFKTPSGNIGCVLSPQGVRCDIGQFSYTPTPKPANCQLDWGAAMEIPPQGPGNFICHGDTVMDSSASVVAYGARARQGSIVCDSEEAGVTCTNEGSGHGFFLSRNSYRFF